MKCPRCLAPLALDDLCRRFTADGEEVDIIYVCRRCRAWGVHFEDATLEPLP